MAGSVAMAGVYETVQNSRPARPPAPTNGQSRVGGALSFVNPLSGTSTIFYSVTTGGLYPFLFMNYLYTRKCSDAVVT